MPDDRPTSPPLARPGIVAVLVVVAAGSLIANAFLVFSRSSQAHALQLANLAISALALGFAIAAAWPVLRRLREGRGMITVCAWTRRVLWQGNWITFEEYLARRFNLRCTHGICDEAARKIRDEHALNNVPAELRRSS